MPLGMTLCVYNTNIIYACTFILVEKVTKRVNINHDLNIMSVCRDIFGEDRDITDLLCVNMQDRVTVTGKRQRDLVRGLELVILAAPSLLLCANIIPTTLLLPPHNSHHTTNTSAHCPALHCTPSPLPLPLSPSF